MRATPILADFTRGLLTPYLWGRTDWAGYFNGLKRLENFLVLPHGPLEFRGGTRFINERKHHDKRAAPIPFEFSDEQAYQIEAGDLYFRFYMDKAIILDGATPYEVVTPWTESQVELIKFCQSNDIMYLAHPKVRPQKLSRLGHANWTLEPYEFIDGPYLEENTSPTTLSPAAATGAGITLTASSTTGINRNAGFKATDVGRLVRIKIGTNEWGNATIVSYTSPTVVKIDINKTLTGSSATPAWRLGLWSDTTGWPGAVTFHEERLTFASATTDRPQRIDGTKVGDFHNHTPGTLDGDAISFSIASNTVNKIRWLASMRRLLVGTRRAEFVVQPSSTKSSLAPTDIDAKSHTRWGSADMLPVEVGNAVLFVDRQARKVRELGYAFENDSYRAPDITLFAGHITKSGLAQIVYQQEPWSLIWARRNDGQLVCATYVPEQKVIAWHMHPLAGNAIVEGLSVIPGSNGSDELWLFTRRTIAGETKRYVEILEDPLPIDGEKEDSFYVDCGLTYDDEPETEIGGLEHLEGQTVTILADGAMHPDRVVVDGSVTLDLPASKIHIGLRYVGKAQPTSLEAGASEGTAQGKTKIIGNAVMRVVRSLGGWIGRDEAHLEDVLQKRDPAVPMDKGPALYTGDIPIDFPGDWDREGGMLIVQDQPLPFTVSAIMLTMATN